MSAIPKALSDINTTSRRRIAAVLLLGVLAATMPFATGEALAQSPQREAGGTTSPTPYQAYLAADCLTGSNFCRFVSEEVPASQRLEIRRVACQGWHSSTTPPTFVVFAELRSSADEYLGRIDFLKASYTPASWGSVWAISEQVLMFIPAGHRMRVSLNSGTTGVGSYGCTISGYLAPAA